MKEDEYLVVMTGVMSEKSRMVHTSFPERLDYVVYAPSNLAAVTVAVERAKRRGYKLVHVKRVEKL